MLNQTEHDRIILVSSSDIARGVYESHVVSLLELLMDTYNAKFSLISFGSHKLTKEEKETLEKRISNFKKIGEDNLLILDVLEHIPDVDAHLSEVRRVLKSGGFYLFQTPNKLTNVPFEIIKNRNLTKHKAYHCSLQTFWSLKRLLATHGFEFRFVKIPVMNEFMGQKVKTVFGRIGMCLLHIVNPAGLPMAMRTNFCGAKR